MKTRLNYITKLEQESTMEQEKRRMHRRMKEVQAQMREEFQMREELKADNVKCKVKLGFVSGINESDTEKSEMYPVSKRSYLKELVSHKIRSIIDALKGILGLKKSL